MIVQSIIINRARLRAKAAAAAAALNPAPLISSKDKSEETIQPTKSKTNKDSELFENGVYGTVKEEFVKQPFKNPENAYKEAMNLISQEDW